MTIKHIALRVKDLERSIEFYQTLAGLQIAKRQSAPPAELAFMSSGEGTQIELIHIPDSQTFEGKGMFICFETDSLGEVREAALADGWNPSPIQTPGDGTQYFYVYDPDGVSVQFRSF